MSDFCKNNEITEEVYNKIGYFEWTIEKRKEYQRAVGFYMDRKGYRPSDTWIERWHQFYEERKKEEEPSEEYIGLKKQLEKIRKDIVEKRREFETLPEFVNKYSIDDLYDLFGDNEATYMVTGTHHEYGKIHRHFDNIKKARGYAQKLFEERVHRHRDLFAYKDIKLERVETIFTWEREG